ncbi:MAG: hypothetical protein JW923_10800 [Spirochaetales bacterium]|nr:hypothetical protein [Spirochaetales bacterium]MBP7262985.1 hypothetical protein [Spirochaetia bacterium]
MISIVGKLGRWAGIAFLAAMSLSCVGVDKSIYESPLNAALCAVAVDGNIEAVEMDEAELLFKLVRRNDAFQPQLLAISLKDRVLGGWQAVLPFALLPEEATLGMLGTAELAEDYFPRNAWMAPDGYLGQGMDAKAAPALSLALPEAGAFLSVEATFTFVEKKWNIGLETARVEATLRVYAMDREGKRLLLKTAEGLSKGDVRVLPGIFNAETVMKLCQEALDDAENALLEWLGRQAG